MGLELIGRGGLRCRSGEPGAGGASRAWHRDRSSPQAGCEALPGAGRDRADRTDLLRSRPFPDRAGGQGRIVAPDQRRERALATLEVRVEAGGLYQGLSVDHRRIRRAGDHHPLQSGRSTVLCGVAVRAFEGALRPVRSRAPKSGEVVRSPRLHHRQCRPVAVLPSLLAWCGRQRGHAAQHLARDASEQSTGCADQEGADRTRHHRAREHRRQGRGCIRRNLAGVRPGSQGGPLRGLRAARAAARARTLCDDRGIPACAR